MIKKITRQKLLSFLSQHRTDDKVLNIGSGKYYEYKNLFPNQLTVDIDQKREPDVVADAHTLPFENESFGIILCTEVLEHTLEPQKVINEFERILRPGGKVILTTRFVYPLHDTPHDYWRFTRFGLLELFKNYKVNEIVSETDTFSAIGALLQRICFQTHLKYNKPTKAILFAMSWIFDKINPIITEYGDIRKENEVSDIMSTGYYVSAIKK